ncbi:ABC transporter ATP-binding protein [Salipaludibacillus sp. HK11]|uniref:ABC transporter ATP-binding protein n=1 Tax=Salipaludibacillus sp. HK11 TaxID=3394320 RepID=UPI0039FBC185
MKNTIFSFLGPYRLAVTVALTLTIVELSVELVQPLLMSKIIDDGIMQEDLSVVMLWGGVMIGLSLLVFAAGVTNSFYAAHVSQNAGFDMRSKLFEKVQAFAFSNFSQFPTSTLMTRMTNDVNLIQNTIFMSLRIMLRAPLLVFGSVIMALLVNVQLALILIVTIPILVVFLVLIMQKAGGLFKAVQSRVDTVNNVVQENLTAIRLIKSFIRRKYESSRFTIASNELRTKTVKALRLIETTMPVILLVMNGSIIAVLWFGSFGVNTGGATVGEVVAIINYVTRMTGALSIFSMIIMMFSRARASSERIMDVLDAEVDLNDADDEPNMPTVTQGQIEFDHVSFRYPDTERFVLDDVSFQVKPGENVAVLGATGSGKTSMFQLIPRLYDIDSGTIRIDGHDIRKMKLKHLRRQIGYVPQEAMLFTGSIEENLLWGKEDASKEEINQSLKDAQIHGTIVELPHGSETIIGQRGVNLSGGQKQRLSIARALIRKPKILLFDDSTSALDVKTEKKLFQALKNYSCTTIMITQKMSTTMNADQILLMEEGRIVASGTHDELMQTSLLYQKIFDSQFGKEEVTDVR